MKGRVRKVVYPPIYREIPPEFQDAGPPIPLKIPIRCLICGSTMVSTNVTGLNDRKTAWSKHLYVSTRIANT
ncbi:MAG: hypothetical protein ACTSU2_03800 [Promethearchaeota archaeon]